MTVIHESERLLFRLFTMEDVPLILELNSDPEVTMYTGDPIKTLEEAASVLEKSILPQYALYNYGRWAVIKKTDHSFIGWCGLKYRPELREIDLGYRFRKDSWGKGYATEAAFACIRYGFEKLGLHRIVARAVPPNIASIRVMQKCGMRYIGEQMVYNHHAKTYELSNPLIP